MWGDGAGGSKEEGSENPGEMVSAGREASGLRLWRLQELWGQTQGLGWALGKKTLKA